MTEAADRPHVLLVGSAGGHLAQLVRLSPWWRECTRTWVTFDKPDARSLLADEATIWAYHPTTRNIPNLLRNLVLAVRHVRRLKPDLVVSTGAAVAVPFFLVARILRIPTVYVEVFDRIDSSTLSGRLCRPIATRFCVQWPEQQQLYPGSVVIGPLL
jgi:UDP-N-acetylglucosamine:LPS N-acetylglucosamine transferase